MLLKEYGPAPEMINQAQLLEDMVQLLEHGTAPEKNMYCS